jgi:hypothetical protein
MPAPCPHSPPPLDGLVVKGEAGDVAGALQGSSRGARGTRWHEKPAGAVGACVPAVGFGAPAGGPAQPTSQARTALPPTRVVKSRSPKAQVAHSSTILTTTILPVARPPVPRCAAPAQPILILRRVERCKVRFIVGRQPAVLAGIEAACERAVLLARPWHGEQGGRASVQGRQVAAAGRLGGRKRGGPKSPGRGHPLMAVRGACWTGWRAGKGEGEAQGRMPWRPVPHPPAEAGPSLPPSQV